MPNLPESTDFTNSSVTEGGFKTAITNLREYLATLFGDDGSNSIALATLGALFGKLSVKSANYTVIDSDRGAIIQCTSTLELALTAASTLGASFSFVLSNAGSGTVTINPSGSELIDGGVSKTIEAGKSAVIYCDGTSFYSVGYVQDSTGRLLNVRYFTANETSYTPTTGTNSVVVEVVGGGGGSANTNGSVTTASNGGGGGFARKRITSGFNGVAITVGAAGGTGGVNGTGGTGGTSSFGSLVSATGGSGGRSATTYQNAGRGGVGVSGDLNIGGEIGSDSFYSGGGGYSYTGFVDPTGYGAGGIFKGESLGASAALAGVVIVYEYA